MEHVQNDLTLGVQIGYQRLKALPQGGDVHHGLQIGVHLLVAEIVGEIIDVREIIIEGFAAASHRVGNHANRDFLDGIFAQKLGKGVGNGKACPILFHLAAHSKT